MLAGSTGVSAADTEPTVFKVSDDSDFAKFRAPLVEYLRSRHISHALKVCILGEQASDGSKWAWVIWPGGKTMILWGGGESTMVASRRILDLKRDVVATEADVKGSTYLVTAQWVSKQKTLCSLYGTQVDITAKDLKK